MGARAVEHFGALHLYRGRLWLGKPRGVRDDPRFGRWMGLCLRPSGIRCYEGTYFTRRRTAWREISAITVRFEAQDFTGWGIPSASLWMWKPEPGH